MLYFILFKEFFLRFKDVLAPWYSYVLCFNSLNRLKSSSVYSSFSDNFLSSHSQLRSSLNLKRFSNKAFIYASGPSLSLFLNKNPASLFVSDSLPPLRVALSTSVYSGIPFDLALFEGGALHDFKQMHNTLFAENLHHKFDSLRPPVFCFTNFCDEACGEYMQRCLKSGNYVLNQFPMVLPRSRFFLADVSLYISFLFAKLLGRIGIVPQTLFLRSSLLRALILLDSLGFDDIYLVGFDGGSLYYYHDFETWPQLDLLRSTHDSVYSRHEISYIANGKKVVKNLQSSIHSTQDPSLSHYTNDVLISLLSQWLGFKLTRVFGDAGNISLRRFS